MASSGSINNTFRTGYAVKITWTVTSQDIANNTSTVTANVQLVSLGSSYTINSSATKNGSLTVNGTKYTFTFNASLTGNQTKTIYTKTGIVVSHNSDGTKSCAFSCSAGIAVTLSGTYYSSVSASGTGTFNNIARASTISSVTASVAVNGTNACTVAISRKSSAFTHTVVWKIGSYSKTTTGAGTSASYAIPLTWLNAIPSATTGTATVTVTTYNGSTKIGATVSKTFKITVPSNIVPTISNISLSEAISGLNAQFGGYVQNKSKLKVSVASSGVYSSTIKSYKTTILGKNYTTASFTSGFLTSSGTVSVATTVTDSRGRTATKTQSVTVIPYTEPTINTFTAQRANGLGSADNEGTMALARIKFAVASVNNKNTKAYTVEYKPKSSDTWTEAEKGSVYSYDSNMLLNINLSTESSYDLRLTVSDHFGSSIALAEIATSFTLLDFNSSGKGLAFGKVSEIENQMEINMDMGIYKNIFMGGLKRDNDEKNMYFQTTEDAEYIHNCKLYGGNGASVTSIGCWDSTRAHGIWRYLSSTQNLVFDANVKVTRANGGDEFITSEPMTYGSRTGKVHFSNGLLIQWGSESVTPVANTPTAKAVKFPTGYAAIPMVITTAITSVPGTVVTGTAPGNVTTTGFDVFVTRTGTTSTTVGWLAIGYKK